MRFLLLGTSLMSLMLVMAATGHAQERPKATKAKAKTIELFIVSQPPGATIASDVQAPLLTPVKVKVTVDLGKGGCLLPWVSWRAGCADGCIELRPHTLRWVSGAEVLVADYGVCWANGKTQTLTVNRPLGLAGVEVDVQYAIHLEQLAAQDKWNRRAALMAYLASRQQQAPQPSPLQPIIDNIVAQQQRRMTCRSTVAFGTVVTRCE